MSLKTFHIVFISLSTLCAFGFSVWLMISFVSSREVLLVTAAAGSFACGVGLIFYGIRFLKKLKHVSFL